MTNKQGILFENLERANIWHFAQTMWLIVVTLGGPNEEYKSNLKSFCYDLK